MAEREGVLVMAYGTPRDLSDVGSYLGNILGRPPSAALVEDLTARYAAIGGRSPLLDVTLAQAAGIGERVGVPVYVGQKFNAPFIADAVARMRSEGIERVVGLVLAPHYSSMSIGDYESRVRRAAGDIGYLASIDVIASWHLEEGYIELLAEYVAGALNAVSAAGRGRTHVVFTAHSLPERIVEAGDPYPGQLQSTAEAVAARAGLVHWEVGWQSAGHTREPWLGPDILEVIARLGNDGASGVVVCPCGFVADHLEVLYDLDVEAARAAQRARVEFARTRMPNDDPRFLDILAGVVRRALRT